MHTTLEYLEQYNKKQKSIRKLPNLLKEIKLLGIIFAVSGIFVLVFTNIQLFFGNFVEAFDHNISADDSVDRESNSDQDNSISSIVAANQEQMAEVQDLIDEHKSDVTIPQTMTVSTESILKHKIKDYPFSFNTLPPTNRVSIQSIGLDVPLITSQYKNSDDFANGVFDAELENGVVKYPTTPAPGEIGNTLIFGHTSHEWRDKNPYGTVFSDIPDLQPGDLVDIVWEGNLYTYRVFTTVIKKPSEVNAAYLQYQDKDYLTLMGCYPLGRTDKRMMVIAERVE